LSQIGDAAIPEREGPVVARIIDAACPKRPRQALLSLVGIEERNVRVTPNGVPRRPQGIARKHEIAALRLHHQALQADRMTGQGKGSNAGKQLLLAILEQRDPHPLQHLAGVGRRSPVRRTDRGRVVEFQAGNENFGMAEQIYVLDMIPVQMRHEDGVDLLGGEPVGCQGLNQHRSYAIRPGVEQNRARAVAQQHQRADPEQEMIGLGRQARDEEVEAHVATPARVGRAFPAQNTPQPVR
jgi:hypothetical protein